MTAASFSKLAFSITVVSLALGVTAQAAALRTFVKSTGSDSNTATNCAVANPCRTLAQAFTVTSNNGEIIVIDAAGYGGLTINRGVSIVGFEGAVIGVAASATGITVTAAANDVVTISNVLISAGGAASTTGIVVNSGRVILENVSLRMLTTGLIANTVRVDVIDTDINGNTTGVVANGTGANPNSFPITGATQVRLWRGSVFGNTTGFTMNNPGADLKSVLVQTTGSQLTTGIAGNATLVNGTGTGCPDTCGSFGLIQSQTNSNPN